MRLRELKLEDAPLMLEWMSDKELTSSFHSDYSSKTIQDALDFIQVAQSTQDEKHFAVVNDEDEYMGTVTLRSIDLEECTAEFAIVVRRAAMGKGYAQHGLLEALDIAFHSIGINSVYWRVKEANKRAIRFFEKHGFNRLDEDVPRSILNRHAEEKDLVWFAVLCGDDYRNLALSRGTVAGSRIISIKTVPTIEAGELSFLEAGKDIAFEIKRIYYISKVPEGRRRGFHAHKELKQLLFCPYGEIQLILDNGSIREEITLNDPSIGVIIDRPIWREMLWLKKDSVLCVAASEHYQSEDYIRDYDEFKDYIQHRE